MTLQVDEDIKYIQNYLWNLYKEILSDGNMKKWNEKAFALVDKYKHNQKMLLFCQNMVITWSGTINEVAEQYRKLRGES